MAELINFVGAILYLLVALREARFLGYKMFIENLVSVFDIILVLHIIRNIIPSDDSSIACHVPVLLCPDDDHSLAEGFLSHRNRRSCHRCYNANHCSLFSIFLSVSQKLLLFRSRNKNTLFIPLQWLQNCRSFRSDDIPHGHGRSAPIRLHLFGVRIGLLPGLLYNISNFRQPIDSRGSGCGVQSNALAHGIDCGHVSDVSYQFR